MVNRLIAKTSIALFFLGLSSIAQARVCPEWFAQIFEGSMPARPAYNALRADIKQFGDPETFAVRVAERKKLFIQTNPNANPLNYPLPENAPALTEIKAHLKKLKLDQDLPFESAAEKAAIEASHARAIEANIRAIEVVEANGCPQLDSIAAMRAALLTMDRFDGFVSLRRLDRLFLIDGIAIHFEDDLFQSLLHKEAAAFADPSVGRTESIRKFHEEMYGVVERQLKTQGQIINVREKMQRLILEGMNENARNLLPGDFIGTAVHPPKLPFLFVPGEVSERTIIESRLFGSDIVGASVIHNVADGQLRSRLDFFDHDLLHGIVAANNTLSNRMVAKSLKWKRRLLTTIDALPPVLRARAESVTMFALREFGGSTIGKGIRARYDATRIQKVYKAVYSRDLDRSDAEWMAHWANKNLPTH